MVWNQTQWVANLTSTAIPAGCYLYGGASDTVAENMLGAHLPSTTGVVRADPNSTPISVYLGPDTTTPFLSTTITTDARGVLPTFAVPGGVSPLWADFGQGSVAVKPWDTDQRLVTHASNTADPHGSTAAAKTYTDSQIAAVGAKDLFYIKTADQTVNNNVTLANDVHLTSAVLPANSTWLIRTYLKYISVTNSADFKFTFAIPAGAGVEWTPVGFEIAASTNADSDLIRLISTSGTGTTTRTVGSVANIAIVALAQGVVIIGATPGAVTLQWAQGTLTAENTSLLTNSYMHLKRVV